MPPLFSMLIMRFADAAIDADARAMLLLMPPFSRQRDADADIDDDALMITPLMSAADAADARRHFTPMLSMPPCFRLFSDG